MRRVSPFAMYDVEAVRPARRYRSRPGSTLDRVNSVLSPCELRYVLRAGTSCRGRPIAEDRKGSISVRSHRRVYVTAGAGGWFVAEEKRTMARTSRPQKRMLLLNEGEGDELGTSAARVPG